MKIDDVIGGQFTHNGVTYQMVEAKLGNTVVWPLNYTYQILTNTLVVTYTASVNYINAGGTNYATVTADVNVLVNGTVISTITGASLTPSFQSGTAFYASGDEIHGYDLGTSSKAQNTETVTVSYGNDSTTVSITQEANVIHQYGNITPISGSKRYDYSQTVTRYDLYYLSFYSDKYDSIGAAAPASGATSQAAQATLGYTANHYEEDTTPWTQDGLYKYYWSSHPSIIYEETLEGYYNGSDITRQETVPDTPTIEGSAAGFTLNGMKVSVASEGHERYVQGTSPNQYGRKVTYTATVTRGGVTQITRDVTLYQAVNIIVSSVTEPNAKVYGEPYDVSSDGNYSVTLDIGNYTSTDIACPASGGWATMGFTAKHDHTVIVKRDWTQTARDYYTWSSNDHSYSSPYLYAQDTDIVSTTTTEVDDVTTNNVRPTFVGSHTGFSFDSGYSRVIVESRGTAASSSRRSAMINISNGTGDNERSKTLTVYQAKNTATSSTIYDLFIDFVGVPGTISSAGGVFSFTARSQKITRLTYESGAVADSSQPHSSQLTTQNCSSTVSFISGDTQVYTNAISVDPNQSDTDVRAIRLTLTATGSGAGNSQVAERIQDTFIQPGVAKVAKFVPYIAKTGTNKGRVQYTFEIRQGDLTSANLTGVLLKYQKNNNPTQTFTIGSLSVSETSSPVLITTSGIPNFSDAMKVKAWFEVTGSTGGFSVIEAGSDHYTYVEFDPYIPPTPDT